VELTFRIAQKFLGKNVIIVCDFLVEMKPISIQQNAAVTAFNILYCFSLLSE
jgi:hypothetical protein